ncbi:hypothetical protein PMIN04_002251 [Paraphaeosphaeria minitans]
MLSSSDHPDFSHEHFRHYHNRPTTFKQTIMASLHALAIPPLIRGMQNIAAILKRAQASDLDVATILTSRVHPTMRPFTFQIKSLTDTATHIPSQINPSLPRSPLPDLEKNSSFDTLLSRIAAAVSHLEVIAPEELNEREDTKVKLRVDRRSWDGDVAYVEYVALEFVQMHAHANFWFHVTTAYNLLRAAGLEIGKPDFLNAAGLKTWEMWNE